MYRILFLYATNNSGHQRAAEAIQKSLHEIDAGIKTSNVDYFTYHYPNLGPFIFRMYVEVMQSIPHTWDYLYDSPEVASLTSEVRQLFNHLNLPKIHKILKDFKPDAVVCTQTIPAGFIATEKEKGRVSLPLFVTITDFVANPYWPNSHVDRYFVPCDEVKQQLRDRGIPERRIVTTGIPIDSSFTRNLPKPFMRRKLGLRPHLFTVLIMGGSQGIGQIEEAVEACARVKNIQIVVVTGQNRDLCYSLRKKNAGQSNILVLGRVRSVSRVMDAADLLVSKPGGLTSSEALAKGLPLIILSPLPGQEERNAAYLAKNGAGERCHALPHLPRMVEGFCLSAEKLKKYRMQALRLGRPHSSNDIARNILGVIS